VGEEASAASPESSTWPESTLDKVLFKQDRLYRHQILRINYTTYDIRRKQDTINPSTPRRDVMVLANREADSDHPYAYARVIGIFHVNVIYAGARRADYSSHRMEFIWVRWYELDTLEPLGGWGSKRLDRLRFPPMDKKDAFGFLDPNDILRATHIIPSFKAGKRSPDGSRLSASAKDEEDWRGYFQNR
jgi:hypothetical protein